MKSPTTWTFLVVALLSAALVPTDADARFGKRTPAAQKSDRDDDEKKKRSRRAAPSRTVHAASAPGRVHAASTPSARSAYYRSGRRRSSGNVYSHSHVYVSDAPVAYQRRSTVVSRSSGWDGRLFLGTQAQVFGGGASLGVQALLEGKRWGFNVAADGFAVERDDGYYGYDTLQALDLHLTYAVFSTRQARLRVHMGVDSVFAQDLVVAGPSIGLSLDADLIGPFGLHASSQLTPFPYHQLDAQAGGSLALGPLAFRGGLRATWLDDAGLVDGIAHSDTFIGPYLGLALVF